MIFKLASSTVKKKTKQLWPLEGKPFLHLYVMTTYVQQYKPVWPSSLNFITSEEMEWGGFFFFFLSRLPRRSDRLHMLMLTAAQRIRSATNLSLHILSCVPLYSGGSTTWHERINCSEIGHDDKLFSSVCWQQYTFLFRSRLLALNARRGEKGAALSFMSKKRMF